MGSQCHYNGMSAYVGEWLTGDTHTCYCSWRGWTNCRRNRRNRTNNIPAVAANAGIFGTLLAAVEAADLVGTLSGRGPFTVLAPTDGAFDDLQGGLVQCLLQPRNKNALTDLLLYHVISMEVYSGDLSNGRVKMVNGDRVDVEVRGSWWRPTISFNNAEVVQADVKASNGVVHAIDAVLVPPNFAPVC